MYKLNTLLFGLGFGALFFLLPACARKTEFPIGKKLECNAERLNKKGNRFLAVHDSVAFFDGGRQQTDKAAHSGKYSVFTTPKKKYCFGHTIKNVNADWYFIVSVWMKTKNRNSYLVAAGKNINQLYEATNIPVEKDENGWQKLELEVFTPIGFNDSEVKVYGMNKSNDTVYFDDLVIERLERKIYPDYKETPLAIFVDTSDYLKIAKKREEAFRNGILQSSDNDWVKGIVFGNGVMMKSRLRLKGDWLDHLRGEKWSYRIKLKKKYAWNHLKIFSIQRPSARAYLYEWTAHKLYDQADVLTTRYGFVPVTFNNQPRGLYAWEEHFVKQLLEWRDRREGPILKFSEDAFWQSNKIYGKFGSKTVLPYFEEAVIEPFRQSKTIEDPTLRQQFLDGQKLMKQYKDHSRPVADIFDLDKLAKYYAILDFTHGRHGMAWHNQRFYYNPVLCKLEPIAFDGFGEKSHPNYGLTNNFAYKILRDAPVKGEENLMKFLFLDSVFTHRYIHYLKAFSDPVLVESVMDSIRPGMVYYDSLLKLEFVHYVFDSSFIRKSARDVREYLPELKKIIAARQSDTAYRLKYNKNVYYDSLIFEDTPNYYVNVYTDSVKNDSVWLSIYNYYPRTLIILGTGRKKKYVNYFQVPEPHMKKYDGHDQVLILGSDTSSRYLFFMVDGSDETFKTFIHPWPYPVGITPQQELMTYAGLENNPIIDHISGKTIFIKQGMQTVDRPVIIPAGYKLVILPGTKIDLINKAMIISYSPVFLKGTKNDPVIITSSDFSGNGFTVLQAGGRSNIKYTRFENLNTLDYKGWTLSGSVTFYESDVDIAHTTFYRNQCEDALNTVRSDVAVRDCEFDYTYSDAFDSDFSTGLVENTSFKNVGNDAIDFSGSRIKISYCTMTDVNDKGISGGENSHFTVDHVKIVRANIGVASKDLSQVEVNSSQIKDCHYGLVLLQKKPEYGPARMTFDNSTIINPVTKMAVEKGSEIVIDGVVVQGKKEHLADIFYR